MMEKLANCSTWALLGIILAASFFLTLYASFGDSAIMDELAHIPAGYGYVKYFDYRLNPEHPPLVKIFAALPLAFMDLNFPVDKPSWKENVNDQWVAGTQFLYESGNDADKIINWARLGPIILTLLLSVLIYVWSRELLGGAWALLPAFLFAFSPTVLSHGHYATTDIGAALGVLLALYFFVKFLHSPSRKHLLFAGVAFGIAQLLKFSNVLLIPYFLFLMAIFYLASVRRDWRETTPGKYLRRFGIRALRYFRSVFVIFAIGLAVIYAVYFVTTVNYPLEKQVADTKLILTSFANRPDVNRESCDPYSGVDLKRRVRCLAEINILMAGNKILRPLAEYTLGVLMVLQRTAGGNMAYFLGEVSSVGRWNYFPVVFLLKEPIPSLLLIAAAALFTLGGFVKKIKGGGLRIKTFFDYLGTNFAEFSMAGFVVFYWLYSINGNLNIGVRHLLPTLPLIYILAASGIKKWIFAAPLNPFLKGLAAKISNLTAALFKLSLKLLFVFLLLVWYAAETLFAYPNFLSYFNEFGGGVSGGYRYVTDSNYDWGQDLKRLKDWADKNGVEKIAIDYFGGGNPKYYLGEEKAQYWWSARGNPKEEGISWLAISANNLQNAKGKTAKGYERKTVDEYRWLENPYEPFFRAGASIFVYKLR